MAILPLSQPADMSEAKQSIVVIEDEPNLREGLQHNLELDGYEVTVAATGTEGLEKAMEGQHTLILLDLMLPGIDGLDVLRKYKSAHPAAQVIILSAKSEEFDRVIGLEVGADDYVTKPFSLRELLARIRARLRNRAGPSAARTPTYRFSEIEVDLRKRVLTRNGTEMRLTTHEAGVLEYLIRNQGRDLSREELLEHVWGYSPNMATRTVDNQILKLRKKIEEVPSDPRHILTVHGTGYRFEP